MSINNVERKKRINKFTHFKILLKANRALPRWKYQFLKEMGVHIEKSPFKL